jgi:hypothetical protein
MERILFGDNQFFAVNHISDEKSRMQSIRFKDDVAIIRTLDIARAAGINTFMCTTHDRIANVCNFIRANPEKYRDYNIFPCMPYAHKYANAVTELGVIGALRQYIPGNIFGSLLKGGVAFISKDFLSIMEIMIDAEMKMFKGLNTPYIFLQNVVTDLLLGLGATEIFAEFHGYIRKKYNAEPGFITMNFPKLADQLEKAGIENPVICTSINKSGFRMSGGKDLYEKKLTEVKAQIIAMQVFAGGSISAAEAIEYVCNLPNIKSILFGASSKINILETTDHIRECDRECQHLSI